MKLCKLHTFAFTLINCNFVKSLFIFVGYDQGWEEWNGMGDGGGGNSKKEMTLRNIYDIALTAIAYLSFGLFVLQVIMCITLVWNSIFRFCIGYQIQAIYSQFLTILDENTRRYDNDADDNGNRSHGRNGRRGGIDRSATKETIYIGHNTFGGNSSHHFATAICFYSSSNTIYSFRSMNCHDEFYVPSMLALWLKLTMANVFKRFCAKIINTLEIVKIIRKFGCQFGGRTQPFTSNMNE